MAAARQTKHIKNLNFPKSLIGMDFHVGKDDDQQHLSVMKSLSN